MMNQKILCPGWDNLSNEQKKLAIEWINSLISFRIATKELSDSFSDQTSDNSSSQIDDSLKDFQFKVVDSSTTSEGISIEEIIPPAALGKWEKPIDGIRQVICLWDCWSKGHSDCEKRCK